jgi:predicted transcriptional regulator of viral defense system
MTVSKRIDQRIQQLQAGTTFDYQTLLVVREEYAAATKALERLIKKEIIKRVSSGIFYKPRQTVFGALKPNEEELLKTYLFENGKRIAYITGLSLYNRMGLTTQIPKTIKIASRDKRIYASVGALKGKPVKSYIDVTDKNYYLLEILDAAKDFNQIPDLDAESGIIILTERLKKLTDKEISQVIQFALKYPPRARALIGSILELMDSKLNLTQLKTSLNPLSEFEYNINENILPNAREWRIKLGGGR